MLPIYRKGFTLIEMLIVIVIIGVLAAALIPRLTGIQARARDTARTADMRNAATALEVYKLDHASYPPAIYAFQKKSPSFLGVLVPPIYAANGGSSLEDVVFLTPYMTTLPKDPNGLGVQATSDGSCLTQGNNYAYYTDPVGSLYAITSVKESKKGNASRCGDTIDRNSDDIYEKVGGGLLTKIYPSSSKWTTTNCFGFSAGTITSYSNTCPKNVVIPESIDGVSVTSIGGFSFRDKQLKTVTIPNSVTSIGDYAFGINQLTYIIIPDSVITIGEIAFHANPLTGVIIGNSVTSIGDSAFSWNQLVSLTIPNSVISIGAGTFRDNKLTTITLPNSVASVGVSAFLFNGINSNTSSITNFVPNTTQTWNVVGTNWVKQL